MKKSFLFAATAFALVGCGGGGSGSGESAAPDSVWMGNYSGTYTSAVTGSLQGQQMTPAATGVTTMTVDRFGQATITFGTGFRAKAAIQKDGTVASVHYLVLKSGHAEESAYPGTASLSRNGIAVTGALNAFNDPSNFISFALTMTKAP